MLKTPVEKGRMIYLTTTHCITLQPNRAITLCILKLLFGCGDSKQLEKLMTGSEAKTPEPCSSLEAPGYFLMNGLELYRFMNGFGILNYYVLFVFWFPSKRVPFWGSSWWNATWMKLWQPEPPEAGWPNDPCVSPWWGQPLVVRGSPADNSQRVSFLNILSWSCEAAKLVTLVFLPSFVVKFTDV